MAINFPLYKQFQCVIPASDPFEGPPTKEQFQKSLNPSIESREPGTYQLVKWERSADPSALHRIPALYDPENDTLVDPENGKPLLTVSSQVLQDAKIYYMRALNNAIFLQDVFSNVKIPT